MIPHPQRCETCTKPHLVPDGLSRHPHFICCDMDMPYDTASVTSIRGCASHSSQQAERDISLLKKAIIEVLDTGFESSERDMALVIDRIDAWEKGELPCTWKGANALMDEILVRSPRSSQQSERDKVLDEVFPKATPDQVKGGWIHEVKFMQRLEFRIEVRDEWNLGLEEIEEILTVLEEELRQEGKDGE